MIHIGLTGWGDHFSLYSNPIKPKDKLTEYSSHFPAVEVDASFYAVQSVRNAEKWVKQTPKKFPICGQGVSGDDRAPTRRNVV